MNTTDTLEFKTVSSKMPWTNTVPSKAWGKTSPEVPGQRSANILSVEWVKRYMAKRVGSSGGSISQHNLNSL